MSCDQIPSRDPGINPLIADLNTPPSGSLVFVESDEALGTRIAVGSIGGIYILNLVRSQNARESWNTTISKLTIPPPRYHVVRLR